MKAKIEVNEATIEQALVKYFAHLNASRVDLTTSDLRDSTDRYSIGTTIKAIVTIDVGEAVAYAEK